MSRCRSLPRAWALLSSVLIVGCAGQVQSLSPDPLSAARYQTIKAIAAGKLSSLPTGKIYFRVNSLTQPAGDTFTSHRHNAGFVYVSLGVQRLTVEGSESLEINDGRGVFIGSVTHIHSNPGAAENLWYFLALWPSAARTATLQVSSRLAYASSDFDPKELPQGSYTQSLQLVRIQPGGRSDTHRFGGVAVIFMLGGSMRVRVRGGRPKELEAGQGAYYLPMTAIQEMNDGNSLAEFLLFTTTPQGQPFRVAVDRLD